MIKQYKKSFFSTLIIGWMSSMISCVYCQNLKIYNYTVSDGLPSSYMYDVVEDDNGFIWVATEDGIANFDGSNFVKDPIPGLANSEIISIWNDSKGRLWFIDLASRLYYFQDGELYQLMHGGGVLLDFVHLSDSKGNLWLLENGRLVCYTINKEQVKSQFFDATKPISVRQIYEETNGEIFAMGAHGVYKVTGDSLALVSANKVKVGVRESNIVGFGDKYIGLENDSLFFFDKTTFIRTPAFPEFNESIKFKPTYLHQENENSLWVASRNGLINIEQFEDKPAVVSKLLPGKSIGVIIQDTKGGYWVTSQRSGLFYIAGKSLKNYINDKDNNQISVIKFHQQKQLYVIGYTNGNISILDKYFNEIKSDFGSLKGGEIYDIVLTKGNTIEVFSSRGLNSFDFNLNEEEAFKLQSFKVARQSEPSSEKVWFGTSYSFGYIEKDEIKLINGERTYGVCPINDNKVWVGNLKGLGLYENGIYQQIDNPDVKLDIRNIEVNTDSTLWLSTQGNGLLVYDLYRDEVIHKFTTENGLLSNNCRNCVFVNGLVWVATNKGLNQIDISDFSVNSIGEKQGLPSLEINDLIRVNDNIIAATNQGISVFKHDVELSEKPPQIYFNQVKILDKDTIIHPEYELEYDQNNIKIKFTAIDYQHPKDILYAYQMEGVNNNWVTSMTNEAQYPIIAEGSHLFKVKAKSINSDWSDPIEMKINIAKPFWKTWWFLIIAVFITFGILTSIAFIIANATRKRTELREKLKTSQLTALRAQMNPHFIFNSLNSIQDFIMREDKRSANYYLSQFSKLMRNVLNMSTIKEVPLEQEIETLNFYLRLEALRFEEGFEYNIEVADDIDREMTMLPSLVLQPYVENAIKHGLMHKKGPKKLDIRFNKQDNILICEVEDNGVGITRSKEIKAENKRLYPSKAMNIIKERIAIINSSEADKMAVKIKDIHNETGLPAGTKVVISINQNLK